MKILYVFRIRLKLRISLINKIPEIRDCSKFYGFNDDNLKKIIECQEAQKIMIYNYFMSKVI